MYYTYSSEDLFLFCDLSEPFIRLFTDSGSSAISLKTPAKFSKFGPQFSKYSHPRDVGIDEGELFCGLNIGTWAISSSEATNVLRDPRNDESKLLYGGKGGGLLDPLRSLLLPRFLSSSARLFNITSVSFSPLTLLLSYSISEQVNESLPLSSVDVELWLSSTTSAELWCRWWCEFEALSTRPLEQDTTSRVLTNDELRGWADNLPISWDDRPMLRPTLESALLSWLGGPAVLRLSEELRPLSWLITGLFRLRSLFVCKASLPTPPDEDVVASNADCNGLPLMSCEFGKYY